LQKRSSLHKASRGQVGQRRFFEGWEQMGELRRRAGHAEITQPFDSERSLPGT